jgi:hypothetical protein
MWQKACGHLKSKQYQRQQEQTSMGAGTKECTPMKARGEPEAHEHVISRQKNKMRS